MIALGVSSALEGVATSATTVTYTVGGLLMTSASPPVATGYQVLAQGQLASSAGSMYNPGGSATALISSIYLLNTGGTAQTVSLFIGGTASTNQILTVIIPAGGWAQYDDGTDWAVFTAAGLVMPFAGAPGGVGTPDAAAVALTASSAVMLPGTKVALTTNQLFVGSRYRFNICIIKTTAAGTSTFTMRVMYGTNGSTADSAIATWTSGTNTGAIDQAIVIIEVVILTLGAAATAACTAFYVNSLTNATGLGQIAAAPGSTATFNSTSASPFLHVDFTMGSLAVCTGVGAAERVV